MRCVDAIFLGKKKECDTISIIRCDCHPWL